MLIKHLPADSAFIRAAMPDVAEVSRWTPTDYLLADLFDLTALIAGVKSKQGSALPPYRRPADTIRARQVEDARSEALVRQRERMERRRAELDAG